MSKDSKAPDSKPNMEKSVIVMVGDYPRETVLRDVPKVLELAQRMADYYTSKGIPKETIDRLYKTRVIDEELTE